MTIDKIAAKSAMDSLGVPLVPGSDGAVADMEEAMKVAERIGYPVLIKAAAGARSEKLRRRLLAQVIRAVSA